MRLKQRRHRFGLLAPRLVIRPAIRWYWVGALALSLVLVSVVGTWWALSTWGASKGEESRLGALLESQSDELELLRASAGTGQNAVRLERSAQQKLLQRIKSLESENAALREDLQFFDRLIPPADGAGQVRIENVKVVPEGGYRYRYRVFFAYQPNRLGEIFRGRLKLTAWVLQGGEEKPLPLLESRGAASADVVEIRHFLRREGGFEIPPGAQLKGLEVQVWAGEVQKTKRVVRIQE